MRFGCPDFGQGVYILLWVCRLNPTAGRVRGLNGLPEGLFENSPWPKRPVQSQPRLLCPFNPLTMRVTIHQPSDYSGKIPVKPLT